MQTKVENKTEKFDRNPQKDVRPGFVTFWLWLIIIGNVLSGIIDLFPKTMWGKRYPDEYVIPSIAIGVLSFVTVIGACLLLKQKKTGFLIIAISSVVAGLVGLITMGSIPYGIVGLILLWLILHIKKNDIPYWDTLE